MDDFPRILVLTLSFGSGHVRAARAVAQDLQRQDPDADARVLDALADCRFWFRLIYVWPYWAMIRYAPSLWERVFNARSRRRDRSTAPAWAFRWGCRQVFDFIEEFQPDVIVAAEVAACEMAALARRAGLTQARIVSVITDYEAEPVWAQAEVNAYCAPSPEVAAQLHAWGAPAKNLHICGIPLDAEFQIPRDATLTRRRYGFSDSAPLVLLMGGGMGPTLMDEVAARLCVSATPLHIVAVAGRDTRAARRLSRLSAAAPAALTTLGWTDDIAALMQAATILVTKPGGLTTAEAAVCGLPAIFFDIIPGPEQRNAARFAEAGAGVIANGADATAQAVFALLNDEPTRRAMAIRAQSLAQPTAAQEIAAIVLDCATERNAPVLLLSISNGAAHTRAAAAIAEALQTVDPTIPTLVVDVADYMNWLTRFTHLTAYLWLVKHAPRLWERLDRYQKRQTNTSPEWYYRRGCRRLFALAQRVRPRALVATEVGCGEIAALLKRDLAPGIPLVAVNLDYEADRAWAQTEVNLYCAANEKVRAELLAWGAPPERVAVWGVPLAAEFAAPPTETLAERAAIFAWLQLDPARPLILVAGGAEGLGEIALIAVNLLRLETVPAPQIVVLAGRNEKLRARCERLARTPEEQARLRVLGWTERVPELLRAADLLVSKLGQTFSEAIASALPIVALPPPPGAERAQYELLEELGVGRAVRTQAELAATVARLLTDEPAREAMRKSARRLGAPNAAPLIARWLIERGDNGEVVPGPAKVSAKAA